MIRYSATKNRYTWGNIFFNKNFENVMVIENVNNGYFYIASARPNYKLKDILNYFEDYIPMNTSIKI